MKKISLPHVQFPLKLILVVPFVTQIFAVVGLVGYLSFRNGQKSVDILAGDVIDKTNDSVISHLDSYLSVPQKLNYINANAVKQGLLDVNNPEQVTQYLWGQMQVYDLTYLGYGLTTGAGAGVAKYDGETITLEEWTDQLPNNVSNYTADNQGRHAALNEKFDFDNFSEDWYNEPIKANQPIWSRIYVWNLPGGYPYITASAGRPLYDANNKLLGMIAADIHLLELSNFLKELEISPSGKIFIIERDGMLIANSGNDKPFTVSGTEVKRVNVANSTDPLLQSITRQVQQKWDSPDFKFQQDFKLRLQDENHYVRIKPWKDEYGLDWLVVTVIPELDFMSEIHANSQITFILCLISLAVATLVGVFTSQQITRPILKLSQASQKLAKSAQSRFFEERTGVDQLVPLTMELDKAGIQELDALADAFTLMAQQLQQTFSELETLNEDLENRVDLRTQELQNTLKELHRTQAQMLQSEKMSALGQMVAGVAHEVNNPINFIYGNLKHANGLVTDLLALVDLYQQKQTHADDDIDDLVESIDLEFVAEDLPKLMNSMRVGAERIREIVKSLRTFSRLDEADFKTADIHEGIDSTLMVLQHRLKGKPGQPSIEIIKDYDELPLVECYPGQLNQVVMNILSNAIDALQSTEESASTTSSVNLPNELPSEQPQHHPTIRIQTRKLANQWVAIAITDNGPGIPEDLQTRLFDPFFTTKPVGQGTGLGLTISYDIITQKHEGYLTFKHIPHEGTTFVIEIPIQQSQARIADNVALLAQVG